MRIYIYYKINMHVLAIITSGSGPPSSRVSIERTDAVSEELDGFLVPPVLLKTGRAGAAAAVRI